MWHIRVSSFIGGDLLLHKQEIGSDKDSERSDISFFIIRF